MKKFLSIFFILFSLTSVYAEIDCSLGGSMSILNGITFVPTVTFDYYEIGASAGLTIDTEEERPTPTFSFFMGFNSNPQGIKGDVFCFGAEFMYTNFSNLFSQLVDIYFKAGYNFTDNIGIKGVVRLPLYMNLYANKQDFRFLEFLGKSFLIFICGAGIEFTYTF